MDSMRVTFVLMIPQIILQVINLSVPALRMQSFEIDDGIYECNCTVGWPWLLVLGILLSAIPFFVALLLHHVKSEEGFPDVLCELDQMTTSIRVSIGVLLITLPTIGMMSNTIPEDGRARAYLLSASLLSVILPFCYNIAFTRMKACTASKQEPPLRRSTSFNRTTSSSDSHVRDDNLETLAMAEGELQKIIMIPPLS